MISDESIFCSACGAKAGSDSLNSSTKFVAAKCTNCGGGLILDPSKETAICPYCNQPYIVEKAINYVAVSGSANIQNAIINVGSGVPSIDNLLARALEFEKENDFNKALDYFNRVLDLDYTNKKAKDGITRIKRIFDTKTKPNKESQEKLILKIPCTGGFIPGEFQLTDKKLYYITQKTKISYNIEEIESVSNNAAWFILKIKGEKKPRKYALGIHGFKDAPLLVKSIVNLKN